MMRFHYVATDINGKIVEGDVEGENPAAVLSWMSQQGLHPVSIKNIGGSGKKNIRNLFGSSITIADKIFITKYLGLMLKVGTDLFKAIEILIADFEKPAVKSLLIDIRDTIARGQPFYTTFTKYPKDFSSVFVNLVKAGEASGNLENVFTDLSVSLEKEQDIRAKITGALIYPAILVCLALIILLVMVMYALPRIYDVFASGNFNPPLFSKIVFSVGLFLNHHVFIVYPVLIGGVIGSIFFFKATLIGKKFLHNIANHTPVIRTVLRRIALQRFASTLSSLLRSGMPLLEALETTADAVGSLDLKDALYRISREGISKGLTIGDAFRREPFFPRVVVNLIAISEKAGHLESVLDTFADFYESEIDASIKILVSFLEPALLVVIGFVVGLIALSVIIPIYQLIGQVG
ncbi:MAG: type II secretion system F family protein [bacterium]